MSEEVKEEVKSDMPEEAEEVRSGVPEEAEEVKSGKNGKKKKEKKKKKFGPAKITVCVISAVAVVAIATWACVAFLRPQKRNNVSEDYGSAVCEVRAGEKFDPAAFVPLKERDDEGAASDRSGTYDGVDVFARINWTFRQQRNWYSEMHSLVNTVGKQEVETYKRYSDGILISSDITTNDMININVAREYCYVGDRVIWRNSNEGKESWDGINTVFPDGDPAGNMNIGGKDGFRQKNGLPATELSNYVILTSTVESAELEQSENAALAGGEKQYTVTYHLKTGTDVSSADEVTGATAYYGNYMVFTSGIDAPPSFKYITLSYTFTEDWLPVSCVIDESYTATMHTLSSSCTSHAVIEYSYDVEGIGEAVEEIYRGYYKQYADRPATGESEEKPLTALDCLAEAFGPVLNGRSSLGLTLDAGGKELKGSVYLDLGNALAGDASAIDVRLNLGDVLGLWVRDGTAYVKYRGIKLSMTLDKLTELISAANPSGGNTDAEALLSGLLDGEFTLDGPGADLNSSLSLGSTEIKIGFHFLIGENRNVSLDYAEAHFTVGGTEISLTAAFGAEGPAPLAEEEKTQFADISFVADFAKQCMEAQGIAFAGLTLSYNGREIAFYLEDAGISWEEGIRFCGKVKIAAFGAMHTIQIEADTKERAVRLAYGNIGAEIFFDDFAEIGNAFGAVKDKILNYIYDISEKTPSEPEGETASALALAEGGEALFGLADALRNFVGGFTDENGAFDVGKILGGLVIEKCEDGLLRLSCNGIEVKVSEGENGFILRFSLVLPAEEGGETKKIELGGEITLSASEVSATMPEGVNYLDKQNFINLIGYFGSAVSLLEKTDISLDFNGTVTSSEEKYAASEGVKYQIDASMETHRGENNFFHLDVDGKNFWIDSGVYAHASVNIAAQNAADNSLYIDLFMLDGAPSEEGSLTESAVKDGMPDFYVTISQIAPLDPESAEGYDPIRLYVPSKEIMPVLSAALPLLGVDAEILNDYMVSKWLSVDSVEQFKALGGLVRPLLQGLFGGGDDTGDAEEFDPGKYIRELSMEAETLRIVLNSENLYGINGLGDVTAELKKGKDSADGAGNTVFGDFTGLDLKNIYDKTGTLNTTLEGTIAYNAVNAAVPAAEYHNISGVAELLGALAKSATHADTAEGGDVLSGEEAPHTYVLNESFYIEGSVTALANVPLIGNINIEFDSIAISVTIDENGDPGFNIRLHYKGAKSSGFFSMVLINGDCTVDITIKNDMVYIKRSQETHYVQGKEQTYDEPDVLYRAMPLENFMDDLPGQLGFILNLGDFITGMIGSMGKNGEGTDAAPSEKKISDFGTALDYSFTEKEGEGYTWDLRLNGESFSDGILGNLHVIVSADKDGYIRKIELPESDPTVIKLSASGLTLELDLSAAFYWRNPGGVMEEGVTVQTEDVSEEAGNAENGMVSTGNDGHDADTLCSEFVYPSLPGGVKDMETVNAGEAVRGVLYAMRPRAE